MGRDIFNRQTDVLGDTFSADGAFITFPNIAGFQGQFTADYGLLIRRLNATYQQQITRLYEVGRPAVYLVSGRTQGDIALDRVQGPRAIQEVFYRKFGDVCQALTNTLDFEIQTGCATASNAASTIGSVAFTSYFCVINAISLNVASEDMLINEALRIMFSSFEYATNTR